MVTNSIDVDSDRAQAIWSEYEKCHDVSDKIGKTAGIEPVSGRIWLGDSIQDVLAHRDADGITALLFFLRIGFKTYYRKGAKHSLTIDFPARTVAIERI